MNVRVARGCGSHMYITSEGSDSYEYPLFASYEVPLSVQDV